MKSVFLSLAILATTAVVAQAQAPARFNYQGIARMANGNPMAGANISMRISILEGSASGTAVYVETQSAATNAYGLYNVAVGGGTAVTGSLAGVDFATGSKFIKVEIDPAGGTTYTDLGASQLLSVPYAMHSATTAQAPTLTLTGNSLSAGGNSVTLPGGGVNGTQNYLPRFATATTLGNSILYQSPANKLGINTTAPISTIDLDNTTDSMALIIASSYSGSQQFGLVRVENNSTSTTPLPAAILATAIPSTTVVAGTGIYGFGGNVGVRGQGQAGSTATTTTVFGMYGAGYNEAASIGVYGVGLAYSTVGGTKYGVYGTATNGTTNWAGYFAGNLTTTGALSKASGTFKIDHPLDPANKYLYHSFVESPEMMNIYNGNVTTDAQGFATVTMPSYFDALNKDFRYQLTAIGTFAQAIVKDEMSGNQFTIQTSAPNVKVSWQVTGVREDAYANAHRVQPEMGKEPENVGKYLHPVELGQPITSEINYELNHPKMYTQDPEAQRGAQSIKKR